MIQPYVDDSSSIYGDVDLDWGRSGQGVEENYDDLSSQQLEYEDRRVQLAVLIEAMIDDAPSWDGEPAKVTEGSAATAIRFLKSLPANRHLPQVAPDGEGDVLLVWEPPSGNCIVTVQDDLLHVLDLPGTRNVEHIDAQPFYGERIPVAVLQAIPVRKVA